MYKSENYSKTVGLFSQQAPKSTTPYVAPKLSILNAMVQLVQEQELLPKDLSHTLIVGVQHLLETTLTLLDSLIQLGIKPDNLYFTGKCYSTSDIVAETIAQRGIHLIKDQVPQQPGTFKVAFLKQLEQLWETVTRDLAKKTHIQRIIILDDGGCCLETVPPFLRLQYAMVGIEQTQGGLYGKALDALPFPLIEVATCAAKKLLEPPLIAQAVLKKIESLLASFQTQSPLVCGVVGHGAIGKALVTYLIQKKFSVAVYDADEKAFQNTDSSVYRFPCMEYLFANCDIIFGCTGKDISAHCDLLPFLTRPKYLVSCTSEDKEFRSLLQQIAKRPHNQAHTLADMRYQSEDGIPLTIIRGGFPVNFDGSPWNVPAQDIAITQAALLGACIQAIYIAKPLANKALFSNQALRYCLDPLIQRFFVFEWFIRQGRGRYPERLRLSFNGPESIAKNSGGRYVYDDRLLECFTAQINHLAFDEPLNSKL